MRKFGYFFGAVMLWTASPLSAFSPPTVNFNLTSPGSGANLGGVYTSPYAGNINSGPTIPVICDDFADDSYVPETWTAYVTQLSAILSEGSTDTYLRWTTDGTGTLTQAQAYAAAAILSVDILGSSGLAQQEYSYALWELFDPSEATAALPSTDQPQVATYLQTAVGEATGGGNLSNYLNGATVTIYSFDAAAGAPTCNGVACPSAPPQEFITVSMAEPPSSALLGLDLLAVGGLIFLSRRRLIRSVL